MQYIIRLALLGAHSHALMSNGRNTVMRQQQKGHSAKNHKKDQHRSVFINKGNSIEQRLEMKKTNMKANVQNQPGAVDQNKIIHPSSLPAFSVWVTGVT